MIISNVNIGSGPGSNDGESIYSAFYKVNQNFANVRSNVDSLTNSVSSVAGRTGNVTLTINDIVGLNTSYAVNSNVTQANVGMKGYVDAKIAANVAALIDSAPAVLDTLNELAAALNDDASFSTTIVNTITLANTIQSQQISAANLGMKGYVDNSISTANLGIKGYVDNSVSTANLAMKGYVDSVASQSIYGNANVAAFLPTYGGNIRVRYLNNNGNAVHVNSTLHVQGDVAGNGLFVGDPDVEIAPYGNTIASFHGNVNAPVYLNVHNTNTGDKSITGIAISSDVGDTTDYNMILAIFNSGYTDTSVWPNVKPGDCLIDSTQGNLWIGSVDKSINFYIRNNIPEQIPVVSINDISGIYRANLNIHGNVDLSFLDANSVIRFGDGTIQTTAYTGFSSYSNVNTLAYLTTNNYATQAFVNDANTALKVYTDGQVTAANTAVIDANIGMLGYVFNANATLRSYVDGQITAANAGVTSANLGMKGYVDNTVSTANIGMKGYVDSVSGQNTYGNANVAAYLPTHGGNIKVTGITNGGNAIHLYDTLHIQGDSAGYGLFVGDPNVEIAPYGNTIASFHGNVNGPVYINIHNENAGADSLAGIALTSDVGDTSNDSLILAQVGSGYNDLVAWPNVLPLDSFIDSTEGNLWIGTVDKNITFYTRDYFPNQIPLVSIDSNLTAARGNLSIHRYVDLNFLDSNSKIYFGDGSIQTTAWTGSAPEIDITDTNGLTTIYYPTFVENRTTGQIARADVNLTYRTDDNILGVGNIAIGATGNIKFDDGTVQTTAWTGSTYGNVQVATYLPTYTGNISAGNVFVPGTSGKIGFSSGGFVQQTSSNANGVTSNTTSGNIQLMSIDLGAFALHTVAFSCNKLTTNDILLVKHVSSGVTSVVVDAYVASDGLAIIWLKDITGNGTGAFTPMLKYAIIRAPSS